MKFVPAKGINVIVLVFVDIWFIFAAKTETYDLLFSGTGNSKMGGPAIVAAYQHESLIAIADELAGGADLI